MKKDKYNIEINYNPFYIKIDGVKIDDRVFQDEMVKYIYREVEDFIEQLENTWLPEARKDSERVNDVVLMEQDLEYLKSFDDKYMFDNIETNEYILESEDTVEFNAICEEILAINKTFTKKKKSKKKKTSNM